MHVIFVQRDRWVPFVHDLGQAFNVFGVATVANELAVLVDDLVGVSVVPKFFVVFFLGLFLPKNLICNSASVISYLDYNIL